MTPTKPDPGVRIETRDCAEGQIGILTLDRPAQLNALSLGMIQTLQRQLTQWQDDDQVALVVLTAAGERAFCAGDDVREVIQYADPSLGIDASATFFAAEYTLDYTLHRYPKPLVCWGQGLILGGGMGLMQGARYRLGTPNSQMAMPEVSIGLFPDAGASWFLNRLPEGFGRFLGVTGAMLNATDALRLGLLDHAVPHTNLTELLGNLEATRWSASVAANDNRLYRLLQQFTRDHPSTLPDGQLARHEHAIAELCQNGDAVAVTRGILNSKGESEWWKTAQKNLAEGCPTCPHLLFALLEHGRQMTFADIFRMELGVATHAIRSPDFTEGVRARITERGSEPRWQFDAIDSVPADYIEAFFRSPWPPGEHPLREL